MFLKYPYRVGYEPLCREVSDSIAGRRFCRVPLDQAAPHATTLMKITSRCGERAVAGLNDALLAKAAESKVIKTEGPGRGRQVRPAVETLLDSEALRDQVARWR